MFRQSDESHPSMHENQCVFLRGFMISERGFFNALLTGEEVRVEDGEGLVLGASPSTTTSSQNTVGASLGRILHAMVDWLAG
jgi:hypothetical protein